MIHYIKAFALIILILMFSYHANSACNYPVKVEVSTDCPGVLLSEEQFIESANNKRELRLRDLQIAQYEGLEELHEARHKDLQKDLKKAKTELRWHEIKSGAGYVVSFAFGAFITAVIAREVR